MVFCIEDIYLSVDVSCKLKVFFVGVEIDLEKKWFLQFYVEELLWDFGSLILVDK